MTPRLLPGGLSGSVPLGRIGGIPLRLQPSWLIVTAVVVALYSPILQRAIPGVGAGAYLVALGFCVLLAISVLLHELAHAGAARAFGWPVTRIVLSLTGGHTSFGRARTTWPASTAVSLAGPTANLVLAGIGFAALRLLPAPDAQLSSQVSWTLISLTAAANLFVALFNLLPGLPLDGGRVLEGLVWGLSGRETTGTAAAAWAGRVTSVLIVTALLVTGLWRSPLTLVIAGLLVWMLLGGAAEGLRQARATRAMRGLSAGELAASAVAVPAGLPMARVRETVAGLGPGTIVVGQGTDGRPVGVLDEQLLRSIPADEHDAAPLSRALLRIAPAAVLDRRLAGRELLETAARADSPVLVVVDEAGAVVGVMTARQLNRLLAEGGLLRPDGRPR